MSALPSAAQSGAGDAKRGMVLVFGAALVWSFGGAIAHGLEVSDPWTIIAWRAVFAALCVAAATTSFVVALGYTSVANILLMQAGVPLIAALLGVVFLREAVDGVTWAAIIAVIAGIGVMVSDSFSASVSFIGDGLALLIAVVFAAATVITRRYSGVRMTPAACLGIMASGAAGWLLSSGMRVSVTDLGLLVLFGAFTLGFGMAMFVTGARMIPSALAALISTMEPVLGPVWVWLVHEKCRRPERCWAAAWCFWRSSVTSSGNGA